MRILYINDNDLPGRRFNGHDLQLMLNEKGYEAKQFVTYKVGDSNNTLQIITTPGGFLIRDLCKQFEDKISMQSIIYPFGELMMDTQIFKDSDIVHYHLIFNNFMSLYSFKKMTKLKPSVWTLHDPWAFTGHCVYPVDCKGWEGGCEKCPYLDRYSPLREDNSGFVWNIKRDIYRELDIDIVVASKWMYKMVKSSPLTKHFKRVHLIPFGIDTNLFKRRKDRNEIRNKLGIGKNNFVIMFRQNNQEWKGLKYIKEMLDKLSPQKEITIVTVGGTGFMDEYKNKYQLIEYEWVNDDNTMVELYSASDLFLMPSVAEAFGLMAIEAMSCSLPVIVFNGTSLPEVSFAPKCGIALERGDTKSFVETVERLISNHEECNTRGVLGREVVEKNYKIDRYHNDIIELYQEINSRKLKL